MSYYIISEVKKKKYAFSVKLRYSFEIISVSLVQFCRLEKLETDNYSLA